MRHCSIALVPAVVIGLAPVALLAQDGDALAIVNGRPVTRSRVVELLMESHGLSAMQQLIVLELAKHEARRRGISVSPSDIQAEYQDSLKRMLPDGEAATSLSHEDKEKALRSILDERGLSMAEYMIGMERNAYLRRIVEQDLVIDEPTLREEYARTYGERVEIRHIQIRANDTRTLQQATNDLAQGKPFEQVAQQLSQNPVTAAKGGLMPPFTFNAEEIPAAMRDLAFSLATGAVSTPLVTGQWTHILKLERRIPPDNARFEDIRPEVEKKLRARVVPQRMNEMIRTLFEKAEIKVLDRKLRAAYEQMLEKNQGGGAMTMP